MSIARRSVTTLLAAGLLVLATARNAQARTITLTAEDCNQMAAISALAPRLSWALSQQHPGVFYTQPQIYWNSNIALLMRFPIAETIPKGQRVTKAELSIHPTYVAGLASIHVRRVVAEWGPGVCHQYRMTYPKKVEWAQSGGRGAATDRTDKDSAVYKIAKIGGEFTVDLTEDIELWYTGGVPNRGWIFVMNEGSHVYLPSPYAPQGGGGKQWKLQITFEPQ